MKMPDRYAPKAFREMWGVPSLAGGDVLPPPKMFTRDNYRRAYHDPADDWGREGGVLRCEEARRNPEGIARGFRNP